MGRLNRNRLPGLRDLSGDIRWPASVSTTAGNAALSGALLSARGSLPSTTPGAVLTKKVERLCRSLSPAPPVRLRYSDVGAGYRATNCHANVTHRVREHGGRRINGWMIWENQSFAEAEFHAVWATEAGELLDITPRSDGEEMILFLPDPSRQLAAGLRGVLTPGNHTTIRGAPYTFGGQALGGPLAEVEWNPASIAEMKRLNLTREQVIEAPV